MDRLYSNTVISPTLILYWITITTIFIFKGNASSRLPSTTSWNPPSSLSLRTHYNLPLRCTSCSMHESRLKHPWFLEEDHGLTEFSQYNLPNLCYPPHWTLTYVSLSILASFLKCLKGWIFDLESRNHWTEKNWFCAMTTNKQSHFPPMDPPPRVH